MLREELPKVLTKKNFIVKVPQKSEEGDRELRNPDEKENDVIVVKVADDCTVLKEGDSVLMAEQARPIIYFKIEDGEYAIFREMDVEAIW